MRFICKGDVSYPEHMQGGGSYPVHMQWGCFISGAGMCFISGAYAERMRHMRCIRRGEASHAVHMHRGMRHIRCICKGDVSYLVYNCWERCLSGAQYCGKVSYPVHLMQCS